MVPKSTTVSHLSESSLLDLSEFSLISAGIISIIIAVVGVLGNSLTIAALLKNPQKDARLKNAASTFIISLCAADFFFCLIVVPFNSVRFFYKKWIWDDVLPLPFMCQLLPFIQYSNTGVSLSSIGMITINRYVLLVHHEYYSLIYKPEWVYCMIAFCYALSFGMILPTLLKQWGSFGYDKKLLTCSIVPDDKDHTAKKSLFRIGFGITCLLIILCYARIYFLVRGSHKRIRQNTPKQQKVRRSDLRFTKMALAIFLSFVICYCPIAIVKLKDEHVKYPGFHVIAYILLYLSACINPIIYAFMNKYYRVAYKSVLMCQIDRSRGNCPVKSRDVRKSTLFGQVDTSASISNL